MNAFRVAVLLFVSAVAASFAEGTNALPTTITIDGITYSNVTWRTVTPAMVSIMHSTGAATIPLEKLPADLQQCFGYDAAKATKYREEEVQQQTIRQFAAQIFAAEEDDDWETVRLMLIEKPVLANARNARGESLLHRPALRGRRDIVELLLLHNAEVNVADTDGRTPLILAALGNHADIARLLLESKANVGAKLKTNGRTALHEVAVETGDREMAELLIARKADVEAKDSAGNTPLICAAGNGQNEVVRVLLSYRAEVNFNNHGITPLMMAIWGNHAVTVDILLAGGADATIRTEKGYTPLQVAISLGYVEISDILRQKGINK